MTKLPDTFPFPNRKAMAVNLVLYATFAVIIPVEVGGELLYAGNYWLGGALWVSAIANGVLAIVWLKWFDKLRKELP